MGIDWEGEVWWQQLWMQFAASNKGFIGVVGDHHLSHK